MVVVVVVSHFFDTILSPRRFDTSVVRHSHTKVPIWLQIQGPLGLHINVWTVLRFSFRVLCASHPSGVVVAATNYLVIGF